MAVVKYASPKKPRRKQADQLTTMRAHTADPLKAAPLPPDSLRDWLAGKALEGCAVTDESEDTGRFWLSPAQIASRCYAVADAMLRERDANDDVDVWEAAFRDQRISRAQRARVEAILCLSRIMVSSRPEFSRIVAVPPSNAKAGRAK